MTNLALNEHDRALADLPAYHSVDEILAHPRYVMGRDALVDATLALYEQKPALSRLLQESGRNTLFVVIMCVNARFDADDRTTWPSLQRITRAAASQGLSSERRIHGLIMDFVRWGFVELRPSPLDRRIRLAIPTAKMISHDQDWLALHYLPLQLLYPDPGYDLIMGRDPGFRIAQRAVAMNFFSMSKQIFVDHEVIMRFMMRDAGIMTLLNLMALDRRDALRDGVSNAEIGARFGASRTQVGKLLKEAESAGLLSLSGGAPSAISLSPRLYQLFDRFLAAGMSGHDLIYRLAALNFRSRGR